jgi:hypothetical protein
MIGFGPNEVLIAAPDIKSTTLIYTDSRIETDGTFIGHCVADFDGILKTNEMLSYHIRDFFHHGGLKLKVVLIKSNAYENLIIC